MSDMNLVYGSNKIDYGVENRLNGSLGAALADRASTPAR